MAAVTASDMGIDTAILESNDRIGKKILMTGDGRCNITNESTVTDTDEAAALSRKYHSNQSGFPLAVVQQYGVGQTIDFFLLSWASADKTQGGLDVSDVAAGSGGTGYFSSWR
ncbi:hypothetical protein ACFSQ7_51115 [Paenibacillus rhizoplanae]